ncbi:hypothetical protein A2715_05745 [Candidatus Woesebacteria bacterium RIFCSPHIGHO2_01_FULL_39_32]|uniref:Uncharacterized protein n=1 Tax=Candidatus Woesebacteria bacterium RIFCSPLOWO2_01_FULL_39_25 TaxID=1802521 RepID=A0A1F8BLU4_9BACT|nr:MAG: hypothetical protein A2124_00070 [Candidatus Woesebacteria bacterium GWB1_37_5]OGM25520.1 MAG: hypothetical protein A2715_05745 [Candidatus Woesebacteria bacterium RIFCSPHIGHO2_01_FULL_39_32]OGM36800.1 MAG: hypothetical protein A3F01_00215 [Candidatus Woesebacteria bacterium RIFCSPHIGHO2_12_FULL_38_11]OGM65051.1 MAG: hypothetical protein A2893_05355 [Candidatus Woesebacteria bacterium RIFCSPLOWO2_01_FULL_39_25]
MKKETLIVVFYILYFSWLFLITYLTSQTRTLEYISIGIVLFYFTLLRERGDFFLFWLGVIISLIGASFSLTNWKLDVDIQIFTLLPIWLPIAWGITLVALRKLYIIVAR